MVHLALDLELARLHRRETRRSPGHDLHTMVAEFWIADSQEWEEVVDVVDVVEDGRWRWVTLSAFIASSVLTLFFVISSL